MAVLDDTEKQRLNSSFPTLEQCQVGDRIGKLDTDGNLIGDVTGDVDGSLFGPSFGVHTGAVEFPTEDPHVAGQWWDNNGTLTRSAG